MDKVYLIRLGKMSNDGITSIWGKLFDVYFETFADAEEYLLDEGYERDYDDVYFMEDLDNDLTILAEIMSMSKYKEGS